MIADIISITAGTLVVIFTGAPSQDFAISDNLAFAMTTCSAKVTINPITSSSSYALIGPKGSPSGSVPEILSYTGPKLQETFQTCQAICPHQGCIQCFTPEPYILINGLPVSGTFGPGLNVVAINPTNSTVIMSNNYDTTNAATQPRPSIHFTSDIKALPQGTIVALSTLGAAGTYLGTARDTITNYLGSKLMTSFTSNQSYCIISTVGLNLTGDTRVMSECIASASSYTACDLRFPLKSLYTNTGLTFCVTSGQQSRIMVNNQSALPTTTNGINLVTVDAASGAASPYYFNTSGSDAQCRCCTTSFKHSQLVSLY
ncbi:hypothetical protein SAMD00019534_062160 [Acytostelium subglobosum LB1]|uniref:hypothetical protein n=1 Tax=Acytostelium subglobosum LB1 TaxID=1410327 RepID=UPI000644ED40|nr:hypothetical protein SAMD00019534_062160 [Acytostelium subglobosum LB1]GAM23041.1 hypothetical protein SAMD00019534_062160 [Acytostelium subglobosum LB1]|eukprot:XP_012754268.1 hypothetical protein SAMD00019534_062160 [Acytostelium subglobosum LB1]